MAETIIELSQISKSYGKVKAIDGISLDVKRGEILVMLGPNGSGKTTTIRLICGVIFPDSGQIKVKGLDPRKQGQEIRRCLGVVSETASLYENLTVLDNLLFFAELYGLPKPQALSQINQLLEEFGLSAKGKAKVGSLSSGQKKRLSLARALLNNPEILFLDEPTTGLDPEAAFTFIELIKKLNQNGVTAFVCTHNLHEAEILGQRFVFLDQGHILTTGSLPELEAQMSVPADIVVRFKGELPAKLKTPTQVQIVGYEQALFRLSLYQQIPYLISELVHSGLAIYEIRPAQSNLERLYFEIRRKNVK